MSRFHVKDTFALNDKTAFVLAGFMIEGEITAGMFLSLPFRASIKMTAEIDRMEFVHRPDGDIVCLYIKCLTPDEAVLWEALGIKDRTVEIVPAV